ncbi:MAG: type III pantothenate kinase [Gemmataceae bacterium]
MTPHVVVDIGNTRIKWGRVAGDGRSIAATVSLGDDPSTWEAALAGWGVSAPLEWVLASVQPARADRLEVAARPWAPGPRADASGALPLVVKLPKPDWAGIDRLLNGVAAKEHLKVGRPAVLIDAGSAVTIDWLDETHAFCGGAIAPGLDLTAEALHRYTALLRVQVTLPIPPLPADATIPAMQVGIFLAVSGGIREAVRLYAAQGKTSPRVFFSGGQRALAGAGDGAARPTGATAAAVDRLPAVAGTDADRHPPQRGGGAVTASPLVAVLTPPGKAAVATLGVAGERAWDVVRSLFTPRRGAGAGDARAGAALARPVRRRAGRRGDRRPQAVDADAAGGDPLSRRQRVVRYLVDLLERHGCTACGWPAFLAAEGDAIRAEAAARWALRRRCGPPPSCSTSITALTRADGAVEAMAAGDRVTASAAARRDDRLVGRRAAFDGPVPRRPRGAPNVGKSSLVNAAGGYTRAVVDPTPGTTRDVVTTVAAFDGWPVELTDTAGLRDGAETLEALGIEQARAAVERADLCLWLVDASADPVWPGVASDRVRIVVNKTDLPPAWDLDTVADAPRVSAATGAGVADLGAALARWLVPQPPPPGAPVPFTAAQRETVERLAQAVLVGPRSFSPR